MGWNDHMDDDDGMNGFLEELLDYGMLDEVAAGITKQVIDGKRALSEKQQYVFDKRVIGRFKTDECQRCHDDIPWSEMLEAHKNGGYCGRCVWRMCKDLAEDGLSWKKVYGDDKAVFIRDLAECLQLDAAEEKKKKSKRRGFFD